jgi:trigger factor
MLYGELKQEGTEFSTKTAIPTKQLNADSLPKFVGVAKGDSVTFDIQNTFADSAAIAHVTGKKKEDVDQLSGEFVFTVEDITRSAPSELNQEFFDKVLGPGQAESEEQFREKVLEIIKGNYAREAETLLRRDMEKALLDSTPIEVPADFLKDWLERSNDGKFSREQIEEQFDDFAKSLKLSLIKNKVAEAFGVKVEYPELLEYTREMVKGQFGMYGEDESMKETIDRIAVGYLADKERDNYSTTFNQVFDKKVLDVIRGQIATDEKTLEVSEFERIARGEE